MAIALPPAALDLLDRPVIAVFTTLGPDGAPHSTPVWIDRDGDELRVNTAQGRTKHRNVERDPRVGICLVDPDDPMHVLALAASVVEVTTEGADDHIEALALKYTGERRFERPAGQVRVLLRLRVDRVLMA